MGIGSAGAHDVRLLDDRDPTDTTWAATGGNLIGAGDVTRTEFNVEVASYQLSVAVMRYLA